MAALSDGRYARKISSSLTEAEELDVFDSVHPVRRLQTYKVEYLEVHRSHRGRLVLFGEAHNVCTSPGDPLLHSANMYRSLAEMNLQASWLIGPFEYEQQGLHQSILERNNQVLIWIGLVIFSSRRVLWRPDFHREKPRRLHISPS